MVTLAVEVLPMAAHSMAPLHREAMSYRGKFNGVWNALVKDELVSDKMFICKFE